MMNIYVVTWEEIQSSLHKLASKIGDSRYEPEIIVGIARGGWVVARILSDLLGVKDVASLKIKFYKGLDDRERRPTITQPISESPEGKNILMVDDVVDTGESIIVARKHVMDHGAKVVKVATIHMKPWSKIIPDYYVSCTEDWVMYPWEVRETLERLGAICQGGQVDLEDLKNRVASTGISPQLIERYLKGKGNGA
jgi:hypothetical protein